MAVASFPDVNITGPVQHFVRATGSGDTGIYFLGTAEVTPQMQRRRYRQNVMNDLAGKTLPFQKTYDGEAATVSTLLTRFSKLAWELILVAGYDAGMIPDFNGAPYSGSETRWSRGQAVYGAMTFEVWQVYDNFFNPAGASANMEIGWYWPQVELLQHDTVAAGTQAEKLLLVFDCTPKFIPQASSQTVTGNERGWTLYTNSPADFPDAVRTPQ